MRLHKWYKCEHCPEFHPFEVDVFLKLQTKNVVYSNTKIEAEPPKLSVESLRFTWLHYILESNDLYLAQQYVQYVEETRTYDKNRDLNPLQAENRNIFEYCYHVVKCIMMNKLICSRKSKLENSQILKPFFWRAIDLFTSDAQEQWMEVFKFKMYVKPLWFTLNMVYQFQVQILDSYSQSHQGDFRQYECKIMLGGELKKIMTFVLKFSPEEVQSDWENETDTKIDHVKLYLLGFMVKWLRRKAVTGQYT